MIKNNKFLKLIFIFMLVITSGFLYSEYFIMDKYFLKNIKDEQNI